MKKYLPSAWVGLSHGVADCISGLLIGTLPGTMDGMSVGGLILLYNILAFAGQLPAGLLLDRLPDARLGVAGSLALIASGLLIFPLSPVVAITLVGLGSAFFHVSGGRIALMSDPGKASVPGIFAAPGVLGLALGGFLAIQGFHPEFWLLGGLVLLAGGIFFLPKAKFHLSASQEAETPHFDLHDLLMLVLLLAIAMRSAIWNLFQWIYAGEYELLLYAGMAAFAGKVSGGFLADRIGWKRYALIALLSASALLTFGENRPWLFLPGIALLQSATPVAVTAMHRFLPRSPATAAGLTFGLAIAIGGIPFLLGMNPGNWPPWLALLVLPPVAVLYFWVMRRQEKGLLRANPGDSAKVPPQN